MPEDKKKYEGDYQVTVSDKGRVSFNLNIKWVIGILVTILGFVGYLLVDEYYIEPMALKDQKIETLETNDKAKSGKIDLLITNQKILLDRSERTQRFIDGWVESNQLSTTNNGVLPESPTPSPGGLETPPPSDALPASNDTITE